MKTNILLRKLAKYFPKRLQDPYDFCGHQVGKLKDETNTILLCLDFDNIVFDYIEKNNLNIDMVITHHPFIFGTKSKVLKNDDVKNALYNKVLDKNLTIYSYHTNFDRGQNGMNDVLANKLELQNIRSLEGESMARGGELPSEMEIYDFSKYAMAKLGVDYGIILPYGKKYIKTVAIIGGGGWHTYKVAMNEGYDIYISGDVPHHGRRDIIANNYNYLDLPHEIENIFIDQMEKVLKEIDCNLNIIKVVHERNPEVIN